MTITTRLAGVRTFITLLTIAPWLVYAKDVPKDIGQVQERLCDVMKWVYTFALIIGIIYIIMAAFKYMTAGGDAEKFKEAHKALIYGVVGIGVAILARGVPQIVGAFLGSPSGVKLDPC